MLIYVLTIVAVAITFSILFYKFLIYFDKRIREISRTRAIMDQYKINAEVAEEMRELRERHMDIFGSAIVPLPEGVRYENGGIECDVLYGPCACGAWHKEGERRNRIA